MNNSDVLSSVLEIKSGGEISENIGVREVIEDIINKVEKMTCTKTVGISTSLPDSSTESPGKSDDPNKSKRRRHRSGSRKYRVRHKKHKWKPYHKLTGVERMRLEERISRRAYRSREKMSASGLTLAPYNTTQFLMEDHYNGNPCPYYESLHQGIKAKAGCDYNSSEDCKNTYEFHSSPDYRDFSSPDEDDEFVQKQFTEFYDKIHEAIMDKMSKADIVRELIRLEDEIERVEQSLKEIRAVNKPGCNHEAELQKIQVFEIEITKLHRENLFLEQSNIDLQNKVKEMRGQ